MAKGLTVDKVEAALRQAQGNMAAAGRALHVNRTSILKVVNAHPTLRELYEELSETVVDVAESQLYKKIVEGDITAIIFTLKTKGKMRGYVERFEQDVRAQHVIHHKIELVNPNKRLNADNQDTD